MKKGRSFLRKVQYQVEKVLASIISDTPLMKNIVQKKPNKFTTGIPYILFINIKTREISFHTHRPIIFMSYFLEQEGNVYLTKNR